LSEILAAAPRGRSKKEVLGLEGLEILAFLLGLRYFKRF
jgi:hypothetical protein